LFLQLFVCAYDLDKQQTVQNTYGRNKGICEQTRIQTYIYMYCIAQFPTVVMPKELELEFFTVNQFVWVSGLPLGPLTRFYLALLFRLTITLLFVRRRPLWRENGSLTRPAYKISARITQKTHLTPVHLLLRS
jgi:hypothetical protein